jgi:hypothetical protein
MNLSRATGWVAVTLIVCAALLPLGYRLRNQRRAAPDSSLLSVHVVLGLATSAAAFFHALTILPALGSPEAIGGGALPLAAGSGAFFVLIAHVGVGLQLRNPAVKQRADKRKKHLATAITIALAAAIHVAILRLA